MLDRIARETHEEAAKRWESQRQGHAQRHPDHTTKRDVTMGGHEYCYDCHLYITH